MVASASPNLDSTDGTHGVVAKRFVQLLCNVLGKWRSVVIQTATEVVGVLDLIRTGNSSRLWMDVPFVDRPDGASITLVTGFFVVFVALAVRSNRLVEHTPQSFGGNLVGVGTKQGFATRAIVSIAARRRLRCCGGQRW